MINRKQAQKRIIKFTKKYEGQKIDVYNLNNRDLYDFILTDTYLHVDAIFGVGKNIETALDRAIERAEYFKKEKGGFKRYKEDNKGAMIQFT